MISSKTDKELAEKTDEDFLSRWSRRKQEALSRQQDAIIVTTATSAEDAETPLPTDEDMPPIESLTEDSDYTGFLSPKVSEALRNQALRKLFHSPVFNICDGLDDYDDDYTKFEKLRNIITADMEHQIEMEARQRMQQLTEAESAEAKETTEVVSATLADNGNETTEEILVNAETEKTIDDDNDAEVEL